MKIMKNGKKWAHWRVGAHHSEKTKLLMSKKRKFFLGEKSPNWKGGRMLIDNYWYILSPNHPNKTQMGYVAEHRLVMEKKIGRLLNHDEVVHHLNGIKTDNKECNLVLCKTIAEHNSHHERVRNKKGQFVS